ncbi:MAG: hypothetical protein JW776_07080 [Candidatus Lokiarchaeota archaeon]|nr:hypothetical protein [Candidatus Lokiarchaeota archaeon]
MKYLEDLAIFYKTISNFEQSSLVGDTNRSFMSLQKLEDIQIPFLNKYINLYHAYKLLTKYLAFIDERDDFLIIVYDYNRRLIMESLLVNLTIKQTTIQDVILDVIPENFNLEGEKKNVFQSVCTFIQNKYAAQLGRMKIIDADYLRNLSQIIQNSEKEELKLIQLFELLLEGCVKNFIVSYPQIRLISTISYFTEKFVNYKEYFAKFQCEFKNETIPITFFDEDWYVTFLKKNTSSILISKPYEFGRTTIKDHYRWIHFMREFKREYTKRHRAKVGYFVDIDWCYDFISDLCESDFPLSDKRLEYLLQRFLYFVKKNEELWDVIPRPIIYNGYVRLFTRICGFLLNPRKLSYWSLPSNIIQCFKESIGPNDQLAIVFTNERKIIVEALRIKFNQSILQHIQYYTAQDLGISDMKKESLYNSLSSQWGFLSTIIFINKNYLRHIIKFLILERNSINPFKYLSFLFLLRKLNDDTTLDCYPILPWFKFFKNTGAIKFYRLLNKLLYDFLEF